MQLAPSRAAQAGSTRRVTRGTAAFAATSIVQRSLAFLLLPVYARVLSPEEYGHLGIITTVAAALGTILGLGLETAIFRAWVQLRGRAVDRGRFVNTVGLFGLTFPVGAALTLAVLFGPLGNRTFGTPVIAMALGIVGAGLTTALTIVPFAILRADERLRDYVRLTGLQAMLGTTMPIVFVVALGWGVTGWMLATALTAVVVLMLGVRSLGHRWSAEFDRYALGGALAFGLPMVPHAASHWGLALSDRVILGSLLPIGEVGVYHLAYQFGLPITVLAIALSQSVQPLFAEAATKHETRIDIEHFSTHQVLTIAMLTLTVALLGPPVVEGFLPRSYAAAAQYVPWIAIGGGLFGVYLIPMNAITLLAGRTRWVWVITVSAAATNISLNLSLVPTIGALAAAISTVVGYLVLLIGVYAYMRHCCKPPLGFQRRRIGGALALIAASGVLAVALTGPMPWLLQLTIRTAVIALVAGILVVTGGWLGLPQLRIGLSQRR